MLDNKLQDVASVGSGHATIYQTAKVLLTIRFAISSKSPSLGISVPVCSFIVHMKCVINFLQCENYSIDN